MCNTNWVKIENILWKSIYVQNREIMLMHGPQQQSSSNKLLKLREIQPYTQ